THPHPAPQVRPAVPDPLGFSEMMVNVSVVVLEPHPALDPTSVPVATPVVLSLPLNNIEFTPHPVLPTMAICHGPASCAIVIGGGAAGFSCFASCAMAAVLSNATAAKTKTANLFELKFFIVLSSHASLFEIRP